MKALQISRIESHLAPSTCRIAMQKVEGSNPFSRFRESALKFQGLEPRSVVSGTASGYAADPRLSDLELRAHGLVESPEGELVDEASVGSLLDL